MTIHPAFHRLELLAGREAVLTLNQKRVILLGLGGVGSWCAEALVRSGIEYLTIIDSDRVCVTNINRQVQALAGNIGQPKALLLKDRLLAINPNAHIDARTDVYSKETADRFELDTYDYIIDAIDSLTNKVDLLFRAGNSGVPTFSAMGASGKMDPTLIQIASLWKTRECTLARYCRKWLRQRGFTGNITCVYSPEVIVPFVAELGCHSDQCFCPKEGIEDGSPDWCKAKKQINGSAVHITGIFGFMLAGLVIQDVARLTNKS